MDRASGIPLRRARRIFLRIEQPRQMMRKLTAGTPLRHWILSFYCQMCQNLGVNWTKFQPKGILAPYSR
jgi:hypothetical protein